MALLESPERRWLRRRTFLVGSQPMVQLVVLLCGRGGIGSLQHGDVLRAGGCRW